MKDQNVEVLLHTPLLVITGRDEIREKPVLENLLRIQGKVISESSGGIRLTVKAVGSERALEKNPHFSEIFIPYHKIDYIIFPK